MNAYAPYLKGFFRKKGGACKKDLERLLGAPENNKNFNEWVDELISEGSLVPDGNDKKRGGTQRFLINEKVLLNRFKNNPLFEPSKKYFTKDTII